MAGGILPVARCQGQLYFLFGREVRDGYWSDFGGGKEGKETPWQTAIREGSEELNGFLGNKSDLTKQVKNHIILELQENGYTTFMFEIDYDSNLPFYFNNNHKFIKKHLSKELTKKNGLFEKSTISWFSLLDIYRKQQSFRPFYRKMIDNILKNEDEIKMNMKPCS